jgi:KDO2-lipid IV(A) lauroyltransferase
MRPPTLRHRLEYLGYRSVLGALRLLPEGLALRLGEGLGWVVGVVLGVRRRTVHTHLRQAFPQETEAWRRRLARRSFRHIGRESLATFLLGGMTKEDILQRTEVVGLEPLQSAMAEGKGAILVTGHFGNWEIAGAALTSRGVPLDAVAQRQRNPLFDIEIDRTRDRLGITVIKRSEAPKRVLRALRAGRGIAIVGDQNLRRGGVFVDFLGKKASTARGAAIFALRTDSPMFLAINRRLPGMPPRYRLTLEPVIFSPSGDMEEDVLRLTEAHTKHLEQAIVESPEQYFWQHRRWKTQPPVE